MTPEPIHIELIDPRLAYAAVAIMFGLLLVLVRICMDFAE